MRRALAVSMIAALGAGLVAGVLTAQSGAAPTAAKAVTITVTATDFKFKLSRKSVPVGTAVTFKVVNKGKVNHDFKIGTKKTRILKAGKSATLKVTFSKRGQIAYLCTVPGHAQLGMKGKFAVGA